MPSWGLYSLLRQFEWALNESTVASGDVVSEATAPDGRGT
jgi:hypothetical protein